jgi:hypothetical protein
MSNANEEKPKRLSLRPLHLREAVSDLLKVKPEPKRKAKK